MEKVEKVTPTEKAWNLVRETLDDEESYLALRQGLPIHLKGSEGTLYILYPSGRFVKVGKKTPKLGRMIKGTRFVSPDYLATIIAWIKFNEKGLEKNWGCGNFSMREPFRTGRELPALSEQLFHRQLTQSMLSARRQSRWETLKDVFPLVLPFLVIGFCMVIPLIIGVPAPVETAAVETVETTATTSMVEMTEELINIIGLSFPFILAGVLLYVVIGVLRESYW